MHVYMYVYKKKSSARCKNKKGVSFVQYCRHNMHELCGLGKRGLEGGVVRHRDTLQNTATHCNMGCRGLESESRKVEGRVKHTSLKQGRVRRKIFTEVYVNISTNVVEMMLRGYMHEWSLRFCGH